MKHKTPTTKNKKSAKASNISERGFATNKTMMGVFGIGLVVVIAAAVFYFKKSSLIPNETTTVNTQSTQETVTPSISVEEKSSNEWKTYTNNEAGFTLKYPANVALNSEPANADVINLFISAEKLSNIEEDLPMLMGRTDALKERERLTKRDGVDLVKIGTLNGQKEAKFTSLEVCGVLFSRSLKFYPNDYRVIVTLTGPKSSIMAAMPEYFKIDQANCGTNPVWDLSKVQAFENALKNKQGKGVAQEWYDTFDSIVNTVALTSANATPVPTQNAVVNNLSVYKNDKYGFEISYSKPYKALTDKDSLYAYSKGVVLFYKGGQAYDVIVEVWDKESDYQKNYSTRLDDVKVIKSNDKFITLFDNTDESENEKIIESFKLTD